MMSSRKKLPAEIYIESLSNEDLKEMANDCLQFWNTGLLPKGLLFNTIKEKRIPDTPFSQGIQFIINILSHEIFFRTINNLF